MSGTGTAFLSNPCSNPKAGPLWETPCFILVFASGRVAGTGTRALLSSTKLLRMPRPSPWERSLRQTNRLADWHRRPPVQLDGSTAASFKLQELGGPRSSADLLQKLLSTLRGQGDEVHLCPWADRRMPPSRRGPCGFPSLGGSHSVVFTPRESLDSCKSAGFAGPVGLS